MSMARNHTYPANAKTTLQYLSHIDKVMNPKPQYRRDGFPLKGTRHKIPGNAEKMRRIEALH